MADSDDDIETRVAVLEHEIARLREQVHLTGSDAGAARLLAAGADHDVSEVRAELRAHTKALNALREVQLEQGQAIARLDQRITGVEQGITGLDQKATEGFAALNAGMAQITALLTRDTDSGRD